MEWAEIFILVIVGAALGVSLFYVTKGAADIGGSDDTGLKDAHKYLTWTAVVGWICIALIIVGVVLFLIFGEELVLFLGGWIITGLMLLITAMAITVGILAAVAASKIRGSDAYKTSTDSDHDKATKGYTDTIVSASVALGTVGLLVIGIIIYYASKKKKEKLKAEAHQNIQKLKTEAALEELTEKKEHETHTSHASHTSHTSQEEE